MNTNQNTNTFSSRLKLIREKNHFTAGICISLLPLTLLKNEKTLFLHKKELAFFETLHYPKRQHSFLAGRYCAKQAIIQISPSPCEPNKIAIIAGIFQQPIVYSKNHPNLQISISHTESYGAAISFPEAHPMAIDIETIDSNRKDTLQSQMTKKELDALPCFFKDRISHLTLLWTAKEALSKILRCGFMVPFEMLEIGALIQQKQFIQSQFEHFTQYHALSFTLNNIICSIVYPRKTQFELDILAIQQCLGKENDNAR